MINVNISLNTLQAIETNSQLQVKRSRDLLSAPVRLDLKFVVTSDQPQNHRAKLESHV